MINTVHDTFCNLNESFAENELAYICLTGKPELQVRDKVAFLLSQNKTIQEKGLFVAREWNRRDLAILKDNTPVLVLELKTTYTFDAFQLFSTSNPGERISGLEVFLDNLNGDCKKASSLLGSPLVVSCMIVVHVYPKYGISSMSALLPHGLIKYGPGLKKFLPHHDQWEDQSKNIVYKFQERLIDANVIDRRLSDKSVDCGESFGLKVKSLLFFDVRGET